MLGGRSSGRACGQAQQQAACQWANEIVVAEEQCVVRERIQYGAESSCVEQIVGGRRRFGRRNDSLQHAVRAEELRALRCISSGVTDSTEFFGFSRS